MNLIFIGSIYSLMHRIFEEAKEPLWGRADRIITLKAFSIADIRAVLQDHGCSDAQSLFDVYLMTGCYLPRKSFLLRSPLFARCCNR